MSAAATTSPLLLSMEAACNYPQCSELAWSLHRKLATPGYCRGASVLELPQSFAGWEAEHRTARKRAAKARRLGYRFEPIERAFFTEDIYEINRSLPERQGRPMDAAYLQRPEFSLMPEYPCPRHFIQAYGVLDEEALRAYAVLYRVGSLALISQILGHGEHLERDVMYLLGAELVRCQAPLGGALYYNRHDSGTAGLRFYKERLGFQPADIELAL